MTDTKLLLHELGWSDELIEAFFAEGVTPAVAEEFDDAPPLGTADVTELTVAVDEPLISDGASVKIVR
jgi:hypothetical protein